MATAMGDSAQKVSLAGQRAAPRWRLLLALVLASAAVLAAGGYWFLWRTPEPAPPAVDLTGAEPAVAQAIERARAEVEKTPRAAAAWGRLGMLLRAHDYGDEANVCFARAEQLDANDPRWPYLQGLTLVLADREAALPLLERASDLSPNCVAPRLRLAEILLMQGRPDEAARHFRLVLKAEPDNARAALGLARLAQRRGDLQEALGYLQHAVASPLVRKAALTLRAEVYQQQGAAAAARIDLRAAAGLPEDPRWPDPYVEEVEQLNRSVHARLTFGIQLFQQGRLDEAVDVLESAAQDAPQASRVFVVLGEARLRLRDPVRAEQAFRRALALTPDAAEAHFQLGTALFVQDKVEAAERCFRRAVALKPAHALAHYDLGLCRLRQKDRDGAAAAFRAALRYRPGYADAHRNLGDVLAQQGKDAEALAHLEEAVRLAPEDEQARRLLAEVKARRGAKPRGSEERP
jgi:tetratricopeptide (TPR) repeat protein